MRTIRITVLLAVLFLFQACVGPQLHVRNLNADVHSVAIFIDRNLVVEVKQGLQVSLPLTEGLHLVELCDFSSTTPLLFVGWVEVEQDVHLQVNTAVIQKNTSSQTKNADQSDGEQKHTSCSRRE
ncbi:MAG: hypothetical protein GY822_01055 [Deltaproteobacteria bacterium]|nr:hypothetical protein [Deltaproteobacteria bacterium]